MRQVPLVPIGFVRRGLPAGDFLHTSTFRALLSRAWSLCVTFNEERPGPNSAYARAYERRS